MKGNLHESIETTRQLAEALTMIRDEATTEAGTGEIEIRLRWHHRHPGVIWGGLWAGYDIYLKGKRLFGGVSIYSVPHKQTFIRFHSFDALLMPGVRNRDTRPAVANNSEG